MPRKLRLVAVATIVFATPIAAVATDLPAPRAVPPLAQNLTTGGPAIPAAAPVESAHAPAIPLWADGAPGFESSKNEPEQISWRQEKDIVFPVIFNIHQPSLVPFLPAKESATGCAVIIAPGGGHMFLTIDREGYDLARWLAARGIAAFVLKYRLARDDANLGTGALQPYSTEREPRADGLRALRLIRSRAAEWSIDPARVGILGFSAGGVPAFAAALYADSGQPTALDPIERLSSRASFHAMIYAELPPGDFAAPAETPPAFLLVAANDASKAGPLTNYFLKLRAAGVPAELHVYASGGHGFGVRTDRPQLPISRWPERFVEWLDNIGMLKK